MKKKISMVLAATMLTGMLAACTKTPTIEPTPSGSTTAPQATSSQPVTLSMMVQNHAAQPLQESWPIWQVFEKNANTKLKVSGYQGNWWESIPLIIASNEMPDIMWMSGYSFVQKFGGGGALVNYLDHLDKMPNFKKWMETHQVESKLPLSNDGKLFLTPTSGATSPVGNGIMLYREDIFKKNSLKTPATFDELYTLLKELKKLYPDSTPWVWQKGLATLNYISPSWDTRHGYYLNEQTKAWTYGPVEESYRKMIEYLNKLYTEKLVPTEFLSLDSKQRDDFIANSKGFIFNGYLSNLDNFNTNVRKTTPEFTMAHMDPPKGPTGKAFHGLTSYYDEGLTVASTSKNLNAALKLIDWLYTDQAKEVLSWGLEGTTYTKTNGQKKFIPDITTTAIAAKNYGIGTSGTKIWVDQEAGMSLMSPESKTALSQAVKFAGPSPLLPMFNNAEQEIVNLKGEAINKYMEENISKFIIGSRPLSEWNQYVEGYQKLGLSDVIKMYTNADARVKK
ncbi:extracellular solute-binding protein [Paenibacillus koleovorans]|uniref:extracellular solute-binding protein n=1 Tax=Paenibacillus koleovorans TaxID=121608 RepID=UPI000FDBC5D2|nr:extracellular solute-binding protein [Paenibacillus koleovorans]